MDIVQNSIGKQKTLGDAETVTVRRPPVRVGIAGLGRSALFGHIPVLQQLPKSFQIMAVCDWLKERRNIVEQDIPDLHTYRRVEDMLDDPDIDLILVSLPTVDHVSCALAALARDKWVIVDTPLATNYDDATKLKAASQKTRGKLLPYAPGLFAPDFRLAQAYREDPRLGDVFEVRVRHHDYVRRDDWQSVKRCLGGATWYEGPDAVMQAITLMRQPPMQLWSELKRVAALGDAEDTAHIVLKSRGDVTADIDICGGTLPPYEPSFVIRGSRGTFSVAPGASEGLLRVIDPDFKFPRRRSSVRTPELKDLHEDLPVKEIPVRLPDDAETGPAALWRYVYRTIRKALPYPISLDDTIENIRYLQLAKQSSPFAK